MSADSTPTTPESVDADVTFYRLQACPYCERVTRKLEEYDLDYHSRFVEPMHSERDMVKRVAGVRTVPVIVDQNTGVRMAESANIVDYLDRVYGKREARADGEAPRNGERRSREREDGAGGSD